MLGLTIITVLAKLLLSFIWGTIPLNGSEAKDMAKYLDPKADLTFKRVFDEHPNLVASLLNSLLPLPDGEEITDLVI